MGGYQPLHWGLFVLIAAAGQWLGRREREFAIVPTIGAALSVLMLLLWPEPTAGWLALVGPRCWRSMPGRWSGGCGVRLRACQSAIELSAITLAAPVVALRHFHAPWGGGDTLGRCPRSSGALLVLGSAALGWKAKDREDDHRFAAARYGAVCCCPLPHGSPSNTGRRLCGSGWFLPHCCSCRARRRTGGSSRSR